MDYINLSRIDIAASNYLTNLLNTNKCLNSPTDLFTHKAERFCFPSTDTDIARYSTTRSPPEILKNIIRVLNNKLKPNEYALWNQLCERDVATPEYYKSGLAMLNTDLKKLSKEFKIINDKLPSPADMSPVKKSNVALTLQHGQWTLPQLIAAMQSHLDNGYSLYTFLNKENSLAIISELLLICTKAKIVKLLGRYDRILHQGNYLTKIARRKLASVIRTYLPLHIDKQLQ